MVLLQPGVEHGMAVQGLAMYAPPRSGVQAVCSSPPPCS